MSEYDDEITFAYLMSYVHIHKFLAFRNTLDKFLREIFHERL